VDFREDLLTMLRRGKVDEFNEVSSRRQHIIDLSGADLSGIRLEGADFRGVTLDGAKLRKAFLAVSDFRGASLRFANLEGADLEGADFSKANLYSAYFTDARMAGASILGADICAAIFPADLRADEIRLAHEFGTRLRADPVVALLQKLTRAAGSR
jgi:uncharacterized protein YjbI with pentapeptide repeats